MHSGIGKALNDPTDGSYKFGENYLKKSLKWLVLDWIGQRDEL